MRLISSTLTLFFKLFIPTFWITFVGFLTLAILFNNDLNIAAFKTTGFRLGIIAFFIIGVSALYYLFMRLKRVEVTESHVYITNYIKTYRYPYDSITAINESSILGFYKIRLTLAEKGSFGKNIVFIASRKRWSEFIKERPDLFAHMSK